MKEVSEKAGLDSCSYELHGLPSGLRGTLAAAAERVPERIVRRHGGWRSNAINSYVQETLEKLLRPSRVTSCN